jgi:hypothetical protein
LTNQKGFTTANPEVQFTFQGNNNLNEHLEKFYSSGYMKVIINKNNQYVQQQIAAVFQNKAHYIDTVVHSSCL